MIGTRLLQLLPLAGTDGTAIPDHQRPHDAFDRGVRQCGIELCPHGLAQALQRIIPACRQALILLRLTYIAGGADSVLI